MDIVVSWAAFDSINSLILLLLKPAFPIFILPTFHSINAYFFFSLVRDWPIVDGVPISDASPRANRGSPFVRLPRWGGVGGRFPRFRIHRLGGRWNAAQDFHPSLALHSHFIKLCLLVFYPIFFDFSLTFSFSLSLRLSNFSEKTIFLLFSILIAIFAQVPPYFFLGGKINDWCMLSSPFTYLAILNESI